MEKKRKGKTEKQTETDTETETEGTQRELQGKKTENDRQTGGGEDDGQGVQGYQIMKKVCEKKIRN